MAFSVFNTQTKRQLETIKLKDYALWNGDALLIRIKLLELVPTSIIFGKAEECS